MTSQLLYIDEVRSLFGDIWFFKKNLKLDLVTDWTAGIMGTPNITVTWVSTPKEKDRWKETKRHKMESIDYATSRWKGRPQTEGTN